MLTRQFERTLLFVSIKTLFQLNVSLPINSDKTFIICSQYLCWSYMLNISSLVMSTSNYREQLENRGVKLKNFRRKNPKLGHSIMTSFYKGTKKKFIVSHFVNYNIVDINKLCVNKDLQGSTGPEL